MAGLACAAASAPARADDAAATGLWLDQTGKAVIDIEPCADKLCGKIVWLKNPLNDQGRKKTDIHNPDAALQGRPLCGLPVLSGFDPDGPGAWTGGTVYDAASGSTYRSNLHLKADGLHVRGYIGISLFGRTETWTRPPAGIGRCS
jgi:uncharacterized protein (DUF2147 family)